MKKDDLECPYCETWFEVCQDDGHLCEEDKTYHEECPHCEKTFIATVSWSPVFYGEQADCLNGAEHKPKEVAVYPKPSTPRIVCKDCGEVLQQEVWKDE
jgi:hypothetical protein